MKEHGKTYATEEEKERRFEIYKHNLKRIEHHNGPEDMLKASPTRVTLGMNQFGDLTPEEFSKQHMSCLQSKKVWGKAANLGTLKYSGAKLPDSIDWVQKGAVTNVKDQAQCGSCWSFSTTGALEGAWAVKTGKLVSLSEQQFVDCSKSNNGCNGGLMDNAFEFAEKNDICTEETYPYEAKQHKKCTTSGCKVGLPKGGVVGFKDVEPDHDDSLEEALTKGPVSVAIEADKEIFQFYKSGVLSKKCGQKLDHGVLAVGYGTLNGVDYWKVKNSWGPNWGKDGYIFLRRGSGEQSDPETSGGECGILHQASFPVVQKSMDLAPTPPHYEPPPCGHDEVQAKVKGSETGVLCAPECGSNNQCVQDKPPGTTAEPACVLENSSTEKKYCALVCSKDTECPKNAKCSLMGGNMGICLYPQKGSSNTVLEFTPATKPEVEIVPKPTESVVVV
jgi:C1A family cysteine protease